MEHSGREWRQLPAKQEEPRAAEPPQRPPAVAVSCEHNDMVRRGSTVRVRQRALQKPRKSGLFGSDYGHIPGCDVGMERFVELSSPALHGLRAEAARGRELETAVDAGDAQVFST